MDTDERREKRRENKRSAKQQKSRHRGMVLSRDPVVLMRQNIAIALSLNQIFVSIIDAHIIVA